MKQQARHTLPLREIADLRNGLNFKVSQVGDGVRVIGVSEIKHAVLRNYDALPQVSVPSILPVDFARAGDILFVRSNGNRALVGRSMLLANVPSGVTHSGFTIRARPDIARVDARYLYYALNSTMARQAMRRLAGGSNISNISQEILGDIPIYLPPLSEQIKVVHTLEPFDNASVLTSRLIAAKGRFKRGLVQQLLGREPRDCKHRGNEWRTLHLADALTESRERASTGAHARKLTVKLYGRGVVAKSETRPGSGKTQYYRRHLGQFIYSKLDFLNGAFGIIPAELDGYESTLDLPAFDVSQGINPRWLLHLFSWSGFYKSHVRLANGGRKARRVSPNELLKLVISIPSRKEQELTAALLDGLDREIALLGQLLKAVDRQKRAVFDKILSGELRPAK